MKIPKFPNKSNRYIKQSHIMKYFKNPYDDYSTSENSSQLQQKSRIPSLLNSKWQSTLQNIQNLDSNDYSVYTGTSGIALLKIKKSPFERENLEEINKSLLSLHKLKKQRHTFLCGDAGPLSIGVVVNHRLGNQEGALMLVDRLRKLGNDVLDINSDIPNEYLYGRAGYLFSTLYVNKNVHPAPFDDIFIRSIIEAILISGCNTSKAVSLKVPLMYQWHNSYYLGAAHGLSGILYLLLQAKEYLTEDDLNSLIKPTIEYLLNQRFSSGNFPSSLGRDSDKYVQWCHGAPGFLYLLTTAYKVFKDPKYLEVALQCGEIVWERGLLRKGYSLCHGVSGNAYCFLELYQTTKDEKHLYRAMKFTEWCLDYKKEHEEYPPDRPKSLYEGVAGPMYLMLDIQNPMEAKFPGFTL